MEKERLDILLVQKGLFESREKAKGAIMAGIIKVNGKKIDKAGTLVEVNAELSKTGEEMPYVSRGGLKLQKALEVFAIDLSGKIVLDVGASTGGFTHCALLHGASKVFAVDVGYGQLAWQLRQDVRVVSMERVNIRYLKRDQLGEKVDLATIDVSFISLVKVLPVVKDCLEANGEIIALIKPQFEAGKEKVGKKGVVKDPLVHEEVIQKVLDSATNLGLRLAGLTFSPITGPEGNIEYLSWLTNEQESDIDYGALIKTIVAEAHHSLKV